MLADDLQQGSVSVVADSFDGHRPPSESLHHHPTVHAQDLAGDVIRFG